MVVDNMMPNIDPRQLKSMMDRMGIKSSEIDAERVVIEGKEKNIIIEEPQVTMIEAQGSRTFQISGRISEVEKGAIEISEEDVSMVMEQAGISDKEAARKALEESNGNIAEAIIKLKGEDS